MLGVSYQLWLPLFGTLLMAGGSPVKSDAILLLDGSGVDAMNGVEAWRQAGYARDVVIVEGPVRTHELVTYWSDLVREGVARPSPTPSQYLHLVRSESMQAGDQTEAALPTLEQMGVHSVLIPGVGLDSRLNGREVARVLGPANITSQVATLSAPAHDPARWYTNAEMRRSVMEYWLQLVFPSLGRASAETG